jgi:hypothetical protein
MSAQWWCCDCGVETRRDSEMRCDECERKGESAAFSGLALVTQEGQKC